MIEDVYQKTGTFLHKRKNMNPKATKGASGKDCDLADQGVDLNRNYGVDWGTGSLAQVRSRYDKPKNITKLNN